MPDDLYAQRIALAARSITGKEPGVDKPSADAGDRQRSSWPTCLDFSVE